MENVRPRINKDGKITSYQIRVFKGRDSNGKELPPYIKTIKAYPADWSEEKIKKALNTEVILFKKECKDGVVADSRQNFEKYAKYVIDLKVENRKIKHKTSILYNGLLEKRINPAIGHIKLSDLRPQHLNLLYKQMQQPGMNLNTGGKLSDKTIVEHHRLIHTILDQAEKELLVPYNAASKASPPSVEQKEANFLEIETIETILYYLKREPIKWQVAMQLLIFTGGRRGEVCGIKVDKINFKDNIIDFCNNLLYTSERGIYEDTLKTESSKRKLKIPGDIMLNVKKLVRELKIIKLKRGTAWNDTGFLLTQENGNPMHPDSVTDYCNKFSEKYNKVIEKENKEDPKNKRKLLPHINPHAFRHSHISILLFEGVDLPTASKRAGHKKISTTSDMYGHVLEKADEKASNVFENVFLT